MAGWVPAAAARRVASTTSSSTAATRSHTQPATHHPHTEPSTHSPRTQRWHARTGGQIDCQHRPHTRHRRITGRTPATVPTAGRSGRQPARGTVEGRWRCAAEVPARRLGIPTRAIPQLKYLRVASGSQPAPRARSQPSSSHDEGCWPLRGRGLESRSDSTPHAALADSSPLLLVDFVGQRPPLAHH